MSEPDTTRPNDPRDHALRLLLEEKLGHGAPPDLSAQILARARDASGESGAVVGPAHRQTDEPEAPPQERELVGAGVGEPTFDARDTAHSIEDVTRRRTPQAGPRFGLAGGFCSFMAAHARWWLTPIWIAAALVGLGLIVGSTGAAPFIYTMF